MNRLITALFVVLCLGLGLATAQNINRSVQLSQDPSGPIGFDSASRTYFPGTIVNKELPPSIGGGCGTGATVTGSTNAGTVTLGTTNNAQCIITFRSAFDTAQTVRCLVTPHGGETASPASWTASPAGLSITYGQRLDAKVFNYMCQGQA